MNEYDEDVLDCFLQQQLKLFPERVATTREEAEAFLEDCLAVVAGSAEEVREYLEEEGFDFGDGDVLEAAEVFEIGDGRFLIVEG
ncbi:MAG: glyoxalase [Lachnospiraceae bacterium]|nr:glyoxalase [Lachnospiraceae bacterium]